VFDTEHDDFVGLLVDPVEDAVGPASGGMDPVEVASQWCANARLDESAGDGFDDCCSARLRMLCFAAPGLPAESGRGRTTPVAPME
jgi:hypothetical protein